MKDMFLRLSVIPWAIVSIIGLIVAILWFPGWLITGRKLTDIKLIRTIFYGWGAKIFGD